MAVTNTFDSTSNNPLQLADLDENFTDLDTRIVTLEGNVPSKFYRAIAGLEPDKASTNVLNISPGSCANSDGTALYATSDTLTVDMTASGAGGLDTGTVANGSMYYIYLIANSAGTLSGLASTGETYGAVTVPSGYSLVRKLPFGFPYHSANWDGIPDFHLSFWPRPFIRYTGAEETATWRALNGGSSTTFVDVDLSTWIPDNARIVYLGVRTNTPAASTPGFAAIRVLGSQTTGWSVGNPAADQYQYGTIWQRVTSSRQLQYKITNDTRLSLFVLGYGMTEPS